MGSQVIILKTLLKLSGEGRWRVLAKGLRGGVCRRSKWRYFHWGHKWTIKTSLNSKCRTEFTCPLALKSYKPSPTSNSLWFSSFLTANIIFATQKKALLVDFLLSASSYNTSLSTEQYSSILSQHTLCPNFHTSIHSESDSPFFWSLSDRSSWSIADWRSQQTGNK